ncbi:MAG: PTS fructose transporter subunit IIA [Myxococcota bacterium]|nr:PTS fructose transporter subunit IIA [Myxococcota bacterium]
MKIGVVLVTHYGLGNEFLQALRLIIPDAPDYLSVSLDPAQSVEAMRKLIEEAVVEANAGEGVLVLTDMFGGTPSNLALSFLDDHPIEVVTGINLPMLIKLATWQEELPLAQLAVFVKEYGQRNISVASQLLPSESQSS